MIRYYIEDTPTGNIQDGIEKMLDDMRLFNPKVGRYFSPTINKDFCNWLKELYWLMPGNNEKKSMTYNDIAKENIYLFEDNIEIGYVFDKSKFLSWFKERPVEENNIALGGGNWAINTFGRNGGDKINNIKIHKHPISTYMMFDVLFNEGADIWANTWGGSTITLFQLCNLSSRNRKLSYDFRNGLLNIGTKESKKPVQSIADILPYCRCISFANVQNSGWGNMGINSVWADSYGQIANKFPISFSIPGQKKSETLTIEDISNIYYSENFDIVVKPIDYNHYEIWFLGQSLGSGITPSSFNGDFGADINKWVCLLSPRYFTIYASDDINADTQAIYDLNSGMNIGYDGAHSEEYMDNPGIATYSDDETLYIWKKVNKDYVIQYGEGNKDFKLFNIYGQSFTETDTSANITPAFNDLKFATRYYNMDGRNDGTILHQVYDSHLETVDNIG